MARSSIIVQDFKLTPHIRFKMEKYLLMVLTVVRVVVLRVLTIMVQLPHTGIVGT